MGGKWICLGQSEERAHQCKLPTRAECRAVGARLGALWTCTDQRDGKECKRAWQLLKDSLSDEIRWRRVSVIRTGASPTEVWDWPA